MPEPAKETEFEYVPPLPPAYSGPEPRWCMRRGATRWVLLTRKYAFKLPSLASYRLFLNGLLANMQEVEFSAAKWPELCPVIGRLPLGLLVVMPRCKTLEFTMDPITFDQMTIRDGYVVPAENKPDSWGYYKGNLVAVDYGS